jgi:cell division protease FtsH
VRNLIEGAHDEAWEILVQYRDVLDTMVLELAEKETLTKEDLERILAPVRKRPPHNSFSGFGKRTPSDRPPIEIPSSQRVRANGANGANGAYGNGAPNGSAGWAQPVPAAPGGVQSIGAQDPSFGQPYGQPASYGQGAAPSGTQPASYGTPSTTRYSGTESGQQFPGAPAAPPYGTSSGSGDYGTSSGTSSGSGDFGQPSYTSSGATGYPSYVPPGYEQPGQQPGSYQPSGSSGSEDGGPAGSGYQPPNYPSDQTGGHAAPERSRRDADGGLPDPS